MAEFMDDIEYQAEIKEGNLGAQKFEVLTGILKSIEYECVANTFKMPIEFCEASWSAHQVVKKVTFEIASGFTEGDMIWYGYQLEFEQLSGLDLHDGPSLEVLRKIGPRRSRNPEFTGLMYARLDESKEEASEGGIVPTQATQSKSHISSKLGERYQWQVRTQHEYQIPPSEELTRRLDYLSITSDKQKTKAKANPPITALNKIAGSTEGSDFPERDKHIPAVEYNLLDASFSDLHEAFNMNKQTKLLGGSLADEFMNPANPPNNFSTPRRTKSDQHLPTFAARRNWTWPPNTVWQDAYTDSTKQLTPNTIQRMIQSGIYTEDQKGIKETVSGCYLLFNLGKEQDQGVEYEEDVVKRHAKKVLERVKLMMKEEEEEEKNIERPGTPFTDDEENGGIVKVEPSALRKKVRFKIRKEMVKVDGELIVEIVVDNEGKSRQGQTAQRSKQKAARKNSISLGWMQDDHECDLFENSDKELLYEGCME
ncbi:hypothetical protein P154DRAFT_572237 [Amniculicola lignicola CBS 123094]|uniref:Uncharacterized protein n=1 Tax=Amniculicola lignicola CBS 123094 TaxID=1392246 RepID=A0A6A5WQS2_9PLEO|nr:hypothetical protein P154DRAFT_572237 [Amniculicola lignicola CBS 123094]